MHRSTAAACLATVVLLPAAASAHSPLPGIEGFYIGLLHPLREVDQALAIAATGLLLGQQRERTMRLACGLFALAVPSASVLALFSIASTVPALLLLVPALVCGCLTVLARPLPVPVTSALAAVSGLAVGAASAPDPGPTSAMIITRAGSIAGAALVLLYTLGASSFARTTSGRPWAPLAIRVLASWIAAAALMMIAFHLRR